MDVLEDVPVAINSLLANVLSITSARAQAKGLLLRLETDSLPPNLEGDPTRLQQALLNYVANAIKFTEAGNITLRTFKLDENAESVRRAGKGRAGSNPAISNYLTVATIDVEQARAVQGQIRPLSNYLTVATIDVEQARAVQGQIRPLSNYLAVATIGVEQARAVQGQITAAIKLPHRSLLEPNWSEKRQETCRCPLYITTLDQKRTKHHRSQ